MKGEKEVSDFINFYVSYFKKHQKAVYFALGFIFIIQLITIVFMILQTTGINSSVDNVNSRIDSINDSLGKKLEGINDSLNENTKIQGEIIKNLEVLRLSQDFTQVADKSFKSVVSVNAFNYDYSSGTLGTGFMVGQNGYIVTNYHVIKNLNYVDVITNSKNTYRAKVVGYDDLKDIALLKIEINSSYLEFEDSSKLQIGQKVIAIGNPLGLDFSVTQGVISGLKRQGDNNLQSYVQTDVPINPGNSGGPLINTEGKVIGINTFKYVNEGVEGLGFALESNEVKMTINKIAGFELVK